jgi:8-amino-7-oxononanoate synthase
MKDLYAQWAHQLEQQKSMGLFRTRLSIEPSQKPWIKIKGQRFLDFASNDYLGLSQYQEDALPSSSDASTTLLASFFGSTGSHLISGHHSAHSNLEKALAHFVQREKALLFSTGYMANLAILQSLTRKGDLIILDKHNHASLNDAAKLSNARSLRYQHLNIDALIRRLSIRLRTEKANKWVVTDSLFSMDGDLAPLKTIASLCQKYEAHLIIDDAHGFGVLGAEGRGACEHFQLTEKECPIVMGTLGKALGGYGAFVSGSHLLIDYLMQFSHSYMYTTAMPARIAQMNQQRLEVCIRQPFLRKRLKSNIAYFKEESKRMKIPCFERDYSIQKIPLLTLEDLKSVHDDLKTNQIFVGMIRPPTVKSPCLRITLSASHTLKHIDHLLNVLSKNLVLKKQSYVNIKNDWDIQ